MKSFIFALTWAFLISCSTMAAPSKPLQSFKLKYLKDVTRGEVVHTLNIKAADFNEALTLSRKKCMNDLLDRHISSEDIIDMCANPRL